MEKVRTGSALLAAAILLLPLGRTAFAARIAADDAGQPIYEPNDWNNGTNGGFGFWDWELSPSGNTTSYGHFAYSSQNNDSSTGNIDSGSPAQAWGIYDNVGTVTSEAVRPFKPDGIGFGPHFPPGPLDPHQHFSVDMDNGFIQGDGINTDPGTGSVGISLQDDNGDNGGTRFEVFFVGGSGQNGAPYTGYIVNDGNGFHDSKLPFSSQGLHIDFELLSPTTYDVTLTDANGGGVFSMTGTMIDDPFVTDQTVSQFRFFNYNAGTDNISDQFVNNLAITGAPAPEPATLGVLTLGASALLLRRRRRS
jgi:hypothetical protein